MHTNHDMLDGNWDCYIMCFIFGTCHVANAVFVFLFAIGNL